MDGVHDLGGMHGFGPINPEPNEPVFHHDWERRVFGVAIAALGVDTTMPTSSVMPSSGWPRWSISRAATTSTGCQCWRRC